MIIELSIIAFLNTSTLLINYIGTEHGTDALFSFIEHFAIIASSIIERRLFLKESTQKCSQSSILFMQFPLSCILV